MKFTRRGRKRLEARRGFEPLNEGFADLAIGPLWYRASNEALLYLLSPVIVGAMKYESSHFYIDVLVKNPELLTEINQDPALLLTFTQLYLETEMYKVTRDCWECLVARATFTSSQAVYLSLLETLQDYNLAKNDSLEIISHGPVVP